MAIKTVSLETAKALKDAGFKQKSSFYWANFGKNDWRGPYFCGQEPFLTHAGTSCFQFDDCRDMCSAPTTDELLEELPLGIDIAKVLPGYDVFYFKRNDQPPTVFNGELPEALAKMWLWLKKENLLPQPAKVIGQIKEKHHVSRKSIS